MDITFLISNDEMVFSIQSFALTQLPFAMLLLAVRTENEFRNLKKGEHTVLMINTCSRELRNFLTYCSGKVIDPITNFKNFIDMPISHDLPTSHDTSFNDEFEKFYDHYFAKQEFDTNSYFNDDME
jgi:hypothetical protein